MWCQMNKDKIVRLFRSKDCATATDFGQKFIERPKEKLRPTILPTENWECADKPLR